MSVVGKVGTVFHCDIDDRNYVIVAGNFIREVAEHSNVRISNWREMRPERATSETPKPQPMSSDSHGSSPPRTLTLNPSSRPDPHSATGIDLRGFTTLQIPEEPQQVDPRYRGKYVRALSNGALVLDVGDGPFATTPGAQGRPRVEWRTARLGGGEHSLSGNLSVNALPGHGSGKLAFAQLHTEQHTNGKPRPPIELFFRGSGNGRGDVVASVMDRNGHRRDLVVARDVGLNERFSYRIDLHANGGVDISAAGGHVRLTLDSGFDRSAVYFKAGNYAQDTRGGSRVTYYQLKVS